LGILLRGARVIDVSAGEPIFPSPNAAIRIGMVLTGTARSFITAADGRQLTVRYARRGSLVGRHSQLSGDHPPLGLQALTDSSILEFAFDQFAVAAVTQLSVANSIILELSKRLEYVYATVGDAAFGSIRQRLIRQLLAVASQGEVDTTFVASVTQQQLADAIGSSREVVARELARLRNDALVSTRRGAIVLLNLDRLADTLNSWRAESPY
jgi:CRP/FNR family transcriptional regulator